MEITVTSSGNFKLSDELQAYAVEKAGKLNRYYNRANRAEVVFSEHGDHRDTHVEIIVHVDGADHHVATSHDSDGKHAVVDCARKLERQLTDMKEKMKSHH